LVRIALRHRDKRDFTYAVHFFTNALDALLPLEKTLLPGLSLFLHLGHATMRASLQPEPASCSLKEAKAAFASCQQGATALVGADSTCTDYALQLLAAALQGIGWCELISANVTAASAAFSSSRDLKVPAENARVFAAWGLGAVELSVGDIEEAEEWLDGQKNTGCNLSDLHLYIYDMHISKEKGMVISVFSACSRNEWGGKLPLEQERLKDELFAGLLGDQWFRMGAYGEALYAYGQVAESTDVLVRAAGFVGGANCRSMLLKRSDDGTAKGGESEGEDEEAFDAPKAQAKLQGEALDLYGKALKIYERLGHGPGQAGVLCYLGRLQLEAGLLPEAEERFARAEELVGRSDVPLICNQSELLAQRGEFGRAVQLLDGCVETLREDGASDLTIALVELQAGRTAMQAVRKLEGWGEALGAPESRLEAAAALFAKTQTRLRTLDSVWLLCFEQQKHAYTLLQECAARAGDARAALCWAEKGRSRALTWQKWEEYSQSEANLLSLDLAEFDELDPRRAWEALGEWRAVTGLEDAAILEYTICPGYGIIIYFLNGSQAPIMHVERFGAESGPLTEITGIEKLEELVRKTTALCSTDGPTLEEKEEMGEGLRRLYDLLIKPVVRHLGGVKHLVVCPHEVSRQF
jgi:tetratricopeptide (TPR) repeat protein